MTKSRQGCPTLLKQNFGSVSERFGRTLTEVQQAVLQQAMAGQGGRADMAVTMLIPQLSFYTGLPASYAVGWFDAERAQSVAQATQEPVAQLASAVLVAPTAMFAGMMLPAVAQAKGKAQEVLCMNNMKQVLLGLITYADDNDNQFPADLGKTNDYLGGAAAQVLRCPLDPRKADSAPATGEDFDPADCSYEFVTPGIKMAEADHASHTVVLRCRFHGHRGFLDGHVERGPAR